MYNKVDDLENEMDCEEKPNLIKYCSKYNQAKLKFDEGKAYEA
jgi:hypothetical protein